MWLFIIGFLSFPLVFFLARGFAARPSASWVPPEWWPKTRDGRFVTGFSFSAWVLPERDQWRFDVENGVMCLWPLRLRVEPVGISREVKKPEGVAA